MKYIAPHFLPNPDYYKYAKGIKEYRQDHHTISSTEIDSLRKILHYESPKVIFNIGARDGREEETICNALITKSQDFKIYSIDTWLGQWDSTILYDNRFSGDDNFDSFLFKIKNNHYDKYVIPCRHTPLTWYAKFRESNEIADFIYINMSRFSMYEIQSCLKLYPSILSSKGAICCSYQKFNEFRDYLVKFSQENDLKLTMVGDLCLLSK